MAGFGVQPFGASPFGVGTVDGEPGPDPGVAEIYELLRGPHFSYGYIEGWFDGSPLEVEIDGRLTTRLPMVDGSVEVDGSTPGVRRTLSASFSPLPGLFDQLAPTGTELRAFLVVRGPDGVERTTAQGVFDVDVQSMGYSADGDIRVTAPDRWVRVQRGRFLAPRVPARGTTLRAQIATLVNEVMPAGVSTVDFGTRTASVPAQVWERDRDKAVEDLAKAASLDVFMDRDGFPTIRDAPLIDSGNVAWTVDAGEFGVLVEADRERNRQRTFNVVVVTPSSNEGVAPWPPQYVWDNDSASPTYAGPDPVRHPELAGPFGVRPVFYSSPLLRTAVQGLQAGRTILARVSGLAAQLSLSTVPNPALNDGDTVLVKLPPDSPGGQPRLELHIVDRMSVPLRPSAGSPMRIFTRSTLAGFEGAA